MEEKPTALLPIIIEGEAAKKRSDAFESAERGDERKRQQEESSGGCVTLFFTVVAAYIGYEVISFIIVHGWESGLLAFVGAIVCPIVSTFFLVLTGSVMYDYSVNFHRTRTEKEEKTLENPLNRYAQRACQAATAINDLVDDWNFYGRGVELGEVERMPGDEEQETFDWLKLLKKQVEHHLKIIEFHHDIEVRDKRRSREKISHVTFAIEDLQEAADRFKAMQDLEPVKLLEDRDLDAQLNELDRELEALRSRIRVHSRITE